MPIIAERLGAFFVGISSKEGKSLSNKEWVDLCLYELNQVMKVVRETYKETTVLHPENPTTWKVSWIMDLKGATLFTAMKATSIIKLLNAPIEPNFPELAGPIYLINTPSVIMAAWKVVKQFLDATVLSKIQLHHGVPTDVFLESIDESVLFEEYGGTNKKEYPQSEYV